MIIMSNWFRILKVESGAMIEFMERLEDKFGGKYVQVTSLRKNSPLKYKLSNKDGDFILTRNKENRYSFMRMGIEQSIFTNVFENRLKNFDMSTLDNTFEKEAGGVAFVAHGNDKSKFNLKYGGGKRGKKDYEKDE